MTWNRVLAVTMGLALLEMVNVGTAAPPATPAEAIAPASPPEAGVSAIVSPGDDFFTYANGEWLDATRVPAGRARWGARDDINVTLRKQVADVVADAVTRRADDSERKVADFYSAYLDEAAIEARGIAPLKAQLKSVDQVHNKAGLAKWLGGNLSTDVDPLNFGVYSSKYGPIGLAVDYGIHGETKNFAYLLQGGLGLPTRESYLDEADAARELRSRYLQYVARMLALAGFDHAKERAAAVLALETAMARIHVPAAASARDQNADNHWARADFPARAPGMDWNAFFAAAGLANQEDFVAWQPDALTGTAALVASEPLAAWRDYLRFHLLDRYAEVLPPRFAEAQRAQRGADAPTTRAQDALDATNRLMPLAVGRLYVEKYFSFEAKANVQAILANVLDAFRHRIETAQWMSPASKPLALAKLNTLYFGVGYPDKWPDDTALAIDPRDAFGNVRRIDAWNYHTALARLARPFDRHDWSVSPHVAMGSLNFLRNSYNFSAGLLQAPKFDLAGSEAANYGAIGAVFGHEISHFVDTLGADYDASGALLRWWTEADAEQYDAACRALAIQVSTYRPFPDLPLNGRLTLVENVADLAGLSAAFDAYRRVLGSRASNREYLRQQDRQFFIGFARAWRAKFTDEGLRAQSTGNDHAPEIFRVATVRNLDAWYEAFDVRPGQQLYLPPGVRARVW
ncbi:MAG: M13 family metallopeptidase [Pseudomonadota bacterium]